MEIWSTILERPDAEYFISTTTPDNMLFTNKTIDRQLSPSFIVELCKFLAAEGLGEWMTPQTRFISYKRSLADWGAVLHEWAVRTGKLNSVESVFSVVSGDDSKGEPFHDIPVEIVFKALKTLQASGKCEVVLLGDKEDVGTAGVKFFR